MWLAPDSRTEAALVGHLVESMRGYHALSALTAMAFASLVWAESDHTLVMTWLSMVVICEVVLALLAFSYRRGGASAGSSRWMIIYGGGQLLVGMAWGTTAWLFLDSPDQWHMVTLAAVLVAIAAVSMNPFSYAAHWYAASTALVVGPVVVRLFMETSSESWVAAVFASLTAGAAGCLVFNAFQSYRTHIGEIRTRAFLSETEQALATERARLHEAEVRLRMGESYDPLTDTLSYVGFTHLMDERIAAGQPTLIACINIDDFNRINDAFGMHVGDLVLRTASDRLAQIAGSRHKVGRISADEFLVVVPEQDASGSAEQFSMRLLNELRAPVFLEGRSVEMSVGIGIARYPEHGSDAKEVMESAIIAMRSAKTAPDAGFRVYTRSLRDQARGNLSLRLELAHALERDELQLHYQPIIHLKTGDVVGAEALLRWHNERLGRISPMQFIPVAENSGLIVPIGEWVIQEAAAATARLRQLLPLHTCVNVSLRQFAAGDVAEQIERAIARNGIPPDALHVEITETTFMTNPDAVRRVLHAIRELGVPIALDDFGTGFSSLGYLRHMNIDGLKLDRDFTSGIDSVADNRQAAIVSSVVALARALNMWVVAEGVEYERQRRWLTDVDCTFGQGYLFARPMPEKAFRRWLQERRGAATDNAGVQPRLGFTHP